MRGYDRAQVDQRIHSLERQLTEARAQVESLDASTMQMSGELADAQAQLREAEKPSYAGLGARIEQLLRSAGERSADVLTQASRQANAITSRAQAASATRRARPPTDSRRGRAAARTGRR